MAGFVRIQDSSADQNTLTVNSNGSINVAVVAGSAGATVLGSGNALIGSVTIAGTANVTPAPLNPTPLSEAIIDVSTSATATLVAGVASESVRVYALQITATSAALFQFGSSGSALTGVQNIAGGRGIFLPYSGVPWYTTSPGDPFTLKQQVTAGLAGRVYFRRST